MLVIRQLSRTQGSAQAQFLISANIAYPGRSFAVSAGFQSNPVPIQSRPSGRIHKASSGEWQQ